MLASSPRLISSLVPGSEVKRTGSLFVQRDEEQEATLVSQDSGDLRDGLLVVFDVLQNLPGDDQTK